LTFQSIRYILSPRIGNLLEVMSEHKQHEDIVKRLKRARGHIDSIVEMLEKDENCLKVAQQLKAVESAITQAKKILIHQHIDHCLEKSIKENQANDTIAEFKEITKYL